MTDRERLPDRRGAELVDFEHGGRPWTLTVGRFVDSRVGEVFLDTPKASAIGEIAADAAIAASVAFQHGAPLETVRHALASCSPRTLQHQERDDPRHSSCKATQLGGMKNAQKGLARMLLAEQVREALGHNEGED